MMARLRRDAGPGRAVLPPFGLLVVFGEDGTADVDDDTALEVAGGCPGYGLMIEDTDIDLGNGVAAEDAIVPAEALGGAVVMRRRGRPKGSGNGGGGSSH